MTQTASITLSELKAHKSMPATGTTTEVGFGSIEGFVQLQRMANMFVSSTMVPQQFQGQQNLGNAVIALDMAIRLKASPLAVMQSIYIVHGRPAWSAKFLLATLLKSGRYNGIHYEFFGAEGNDDWGCALVATEIATGMEVRGPRITIALAKAEGWYSKNGSKWKTMPELMLRYRAVSWFVQTYCPDIAMGLPEAEEARDVIDVTPANDDMPEIPTTTAKEIASKAKRGRKPKQIETAPTEDAETVAPLETLPEEVPAEMPQEGPTDEEVYATLPDSLPDNDPSMIECPDRDGDKVSETFCRSGCKHYNNRSCPQWDWGI